MRIETSTTSLSWIPSEAIAGATKLPMEIGITHYDQAPPDRLDGPETLEELRAADRFRFANHLAVWADIDGGEVGDAGFADHSGGVIGSTTLQVGKRSATFAAVPFPDLQAEVERGDGWVRFTQSGGGRTGVPTPRRVNRPPFVQISSPTAWSTLAVTIHADGRVEPELTGASLFPRHWVYGGDGELIAKTGIIDFKTWYRNAFGKHSPWGDEDSPALVTAIETELEKRLVHELMRGTGKPDIRKVKAGKALVEQGDPGDALFMLLDGVLRIEVDGEPLAEIGPGALLGERAVLEGGRRTSSMWAVTRCTLAQVSADAVDRDALAEVATSHRREEES